MIHVQNLQKSFGPTKAVDDVSFEIAEGETFGLLGPNGAGKTTTLSMITGLTRPDHGQISLDGDSAGGGTTTRMKIGIAPQSLALYEDLTARENLNFFAKLYGITGKRLKDRVDWALEFAELTDRQRDLVKTFSGGMKRRLNMATALVHDPQIVLFDEPTVGVDPQSRNHIFERIEEIRKSGCTIVYTTHYMEEAQRLCDRVAIMDVGKILDIDCVDNLITRHGGQSLIKAKLTRPPENPSIFPVPLDGLSVRFESDIPFDEIARLSTSGIAFDTLEISRPDLEAVFLNLTGRSLRD